MAKKFLSGKFKTTSCIHTEQKEKSKHFAILPYNYLHFYLLSVESKSILKISLGKSLPLLGDLKEGKPLPTPHQNATVVHPPALLWSLKVKTAQHQTFRLLFKAHF